MSSPETVSSIILAGGKGTRLKSQHPKVLHRLFGKSLLGWVCHSLSQLDAACPNTYVIVGHGKDEVYEHLENLKNDYPTLGLSSVLQEPQLGTGHAIQAVKNAETLSGDVFILSGDVPLIRPQTLTALLKTHRDNNADMTMVVANLSNPSGYGRVVTEKSESGQSKKVTRIIEDKDASPSEQLIQTVNGGIYCLKWEVIAPLLDQLKNDNAQGEYYLTDIVGLAVAQNLTVIPFMLPDPLEMCGINHRLDLAACYDLMNQRTLARLMDNGVTILNPASTMIGPEVTVDSDTVIYPGCYLEGKITIGKSCQIGPQTTLQGTVDIGDQSAVVHSVVKDSTISNNSSIGPYAHLRDGATVDHHVKIGNFVEMKNAEIGHHSFASHLAYIGDAKLGSDVNFGAGAITANYDPIRDTKHQTVIEDGVKVGCNSVLVAPIEIKERSCVAAGSVITKDVKPWSLAIARGRQQELTDWVKKILGEKVTK